MPACTRDHSRTALVAAALAVFAWGATASAVSPREIRNSTWSLESVSGQAPVAGTSPVLTFHEQYRISGQGGCNQFFGIYGADDREVAIRTVQAAQQQCAPEIMQQEQTFLEALRNAEDMSIGDDGRLTVRGPQQRVALVLTPVAP